MRTDADTANLGGQAFDRIELPLIRVDEYLSRFARSIGGIVRVNDHGRPARDVVVESPTGIIRRIEIAPVLRRPHVVPQDNQVKYVITIYAYRKNDHLSTGFTEFIATYLRLPSGSERIAILLQNCWDKLQQIRDNQV